MPRLLPLLPLLGVLVSSTAAQEWHVLSPDDLSASAEASFEVAEDGSVLVSSEAELDRYRIECRTEIEGIRAVRLEVLPHDSLPAKGPGMAANGGFVLSEVRLRSVVGRGSRAVQLIDATASYANVGWPPLAAIDSRDDTGWAVNDRTGRPEEIVLNLERTLGKGARTLVLDLDFAPGGRRSIGRFRVSVTSSGGTITAAGVDAAWGEMQRSINSAVDRGVAYLLEQQDLDGSWSGQQDHYRTGATALCLYALVKSGVKPDHQAVRRAVAFLDAHPPEKTYEAGCQLMAYAALNHDLHRDHAREIVDLLLDWQIGDWGYPGAHGNPSAGHRDLSNTQYGALGLWAAGKMGIEIPNRAWERLASTVLQYQAGASDLPVAGFGYSPGAAPTGAMSAAGVTVLALCEPHLGGGVARDAHLGIQRGLAWLDENFSPNSNPGAGPRIWLGYYLYGVERVGAFTDTTQLNGQDWYREGARHLLSIQHGPGNWSDPWGRPQSTTCYGLLFLNKASAPSTGPGGGRKGATYGEDDPEVAVSLRAAGDTPLSVWISSFGNEVLDAYTFEDEKSPRVIKVEYLTPDGVVMPDSRDGGAEWLHTTRRPDDGWAQPGFNTKGWKRGRGAFGREDSPQLSVSTKWTSPDLWMRRSIDLDPSRMVDPRLELSFSGSVPAGSRGPKGDLLKLYDEEPGFPQLLEHATGASQVIQVEGSAESGDHYLRVGAVQRQSPKIPGWAFPIREKPGEGEYRYVHFAWRKPTGGVMVQFALNGGWSNVQRYHAGPNRAGYNPSLEISRKTPERWNVVTRDLWQDYGRDALLTGIALTAMDGEADFDGIYLGRTRSAFQRMSRVRTQKPEWATMVSAGQSAGAEGTISVWINGQSVYEGDGAGLGFESILEGEGLLEVLRQGSNLIAVHAVNSSVGQALDLGIRDAKRLAETKGNPTKESRGARYAARISFPRPGLYEVQARVHVLDGVTEEPVVFESDPLEVRVAEALAPEMLEYASDSLRNLLAGANVEVQASSEFNGWPAENAVDNTQYRAWLSADGDRTPTLHIKLRRAVKADSLVLSHTRMDRKDANRSGLPTRVALVLNGKGEPIVAELDPDRLMKTVIDLGGAARVREIELRVLDSSPSGNPGLTAVGFAEVELQLRGR